MLTAEELRQIQRLSVQAGRRVDSLFAGGYRSAFKGRGMEFDEVRPYVEGDDVRHIDWNVMARTDSAYVKVFQEERELTMMLAIDVSGSMGFGSGGRDGLTDKRKQQARIAGALAYAAIRNNDRVGLLCFSDKTELFVPPRKSRGRRSSRRHISRRHAPQAQPPRLRGHPPWTRRAGAAASPRARRAHRPRAACAEARARVAPASSPPPPPWRAAAPPAACSGSHPCAPSRTTSDPSPSATGLPKR